MTDLSQLPPPEKKVAAKILMKHGYSTRTLEDWLGADFTTISRWAAKDTPEELQRFATQFETELAGVKRKGVAAIHSRILELVPKERKLSELVRAGEYLEGKSTNQVNVGIANNNGVTYVIEGSSDEETFDRLTSEANTDLPKQQS